MKRILLITKFLLGAAIATMAQNVGINSTGAQPNASAILDLSSTAKGLLIPRMTAAQRTAIITPATGLLVYQTDATKGFYYFSGTLWMQLGASTANLTGWSTSGNAGINPVTNFIGTADAQPFIARVNGEQVFSFSPGSTSTVIGTQASKAVPAGGTENHIIGFQSGFSNTGFDNHFEGYQAGYGNTNGYSNQFIGFKAGYSTTIGTQNLFIGQLAGYANISGSNSHFVGYGAGYSNTTGTNNHFNGHNAGEYNTTGSNNHFEGFEAGFSNNTGSNNYFSGLQAGRSSKGANNNYFSGLQAGYNNTTGTNNFFEGFQSGYWNTTGSSNYFSGNSAGFANVSGISNTFSGNSAGYNNDAGSNNSFNGYHAGFLNGSGSDNVSAGSQSLNSNTSGNSNAAIGRASLFSNKTGYSNVAIGAGAMFHSVKPGNTVAVGDSALYNNGTIYYDQTGSTENTAIGSKASLQNGYGYDNTATGFHALLNNENGMGNTANGAWSLVSNLGSRNTAIGFESMPHLVGGNNNVAVGYYAMKYINTGYNNTAIGDNTIVADGVSNSTVIGTDAGVSVSNQVVIGSSTVTQIGGYTSWTNLSDGRFKKDVRENVSGLNFIKQLRPVTYTLDIPKLNTFLGKDEEDKNIKGAGETNSRTADFITAQAQKIKAESIANAQSIVYSGFVAQEVEAAAGKAGYNFSGVKKPANDKDHYSLAYSDFVVPLVKAVQEQQKMIEDLKLQNDLQQKENVMLRKDLELIKAKLGLQ